MIGRTQWTIANAWYPIWYAELAFVEFRVRERAALRAASNDDAGRAAIIELMTQRDVVLDALGRLESFLDSRTARDIGTIEFN